MHRPDIFRELAKQTILFIDKSVIAQSPTITLIIAWFA
jgi:hypothetical protein